MNLWTDSKCKWDLESNSKPEIEEKHLLHKDMSNTILKTLIHIEVNNTSPVDKVINFIKINEFLD